VTRIHELLLQFAISKPIERGACHEQKIVVRRHQLLMGAKNFPKTALRAVAADGGPDRRSRSDYSKSGLGGSGRDDGLFFPPAPPEGEGPAIMTAPAFPHGTEIVLTAQVLLGAETHGAKTGAAAARSSDDRQALATLQAAGSEHFAAAAGGHAGTEANLACAFFAMRAEGRLHDFRE
jgi:hypothetical protein